MEVGVCMASIEAKGFGHDGNEGLPARADAAHMVRWLFSPDSEVSFRAPIPSVKLRQDGTIRVGFINGDRAWALIFLCEGVLKSACVGKGATREATLCLRDAGWAEVLLDHHRCFHEESAWPEPSKTPGKPKRPR